MKKVFRILLIYFCFLSLFASSYTYAVSGKVTAKSVRLRKENNAESDIITQIKKDETVEIISEKENWYNVKYKEFTGFVSKEYIKSDEVVVDNTVNNEENSKKVSNELESQEEAKQENIEKNTIVINKEYNLKKDIKLRLNPNFSSVCIENVEKDKTVKILKELGNWVEILVNNKNGWIYKNSVQIEIENINPLEQGKDNNSGEKPVEQEKPNDIITEVKQPEIKKGYINEDTVNIRNGASKTSKRLGFLDLNDEVEIISEEGEWYKVKTNKYGEGYIFKNLVSSTKVTSRALEEQRNINVSNEDSNKIVNTLSNENIKSNLGEEIVNFAKQYLGYSYVLGGRNPSSGFDCSGFTKYVYSNFNISLGSTAASQASNSGIKIERNSLQAGDLILFEDEGRTKIGHCGIYIGNNTFIHAANPKRGVVTDKLDGNSYYSQRYVDAYRF